MRPATSHLNRLQFVLLTIALIGLAPGVSEDAPETPEMRGDRPVDPQKDRGEWARAKVIIDALRAEGPCAGSGKESESLRQILASELRMLGTVSGSRRREPRVPGPYRVDALPYWEGFAFYRLFGHSLLYRWQENPSVYAAAWLCLFEALGSTGLTDRVKEQLAGLVIRCAREARAIREGRLGEHEGLAVEPDPRWERHKLFMLSMSRSFAGRKGDEWKRWAIFTHLYYGFVRDVKTIVSREDYRRFAELLDSLQLPSIPLEGTTGVGKSPELPARGRRYSGRGASIE